MYLDYTGGGLHAASQIDAHAELLRTPRARQPALEQPDVAGHDRAGRAGPRSRCTSSSTPRPTSTCACSRPTPAPRCALVGEAYRFAPGGTFALTFDNHNSVNGIREFARRDGAPRSRTCPSSRPSCASTATAMRRCSPAADPARHNLLAFPAQSNFSGVQHPLDLVDEAHAAGWDVLVDAAAFAPTNRLDVGRASGPTSRRSRSTRCSASRPASAACWCAATGSDALQRPWFAGGTITIASVQGDGHYLHDDEAGFEDGTVDYLNLPAVDDRAARTSSASACDAIHDRVDVPDGVAARRARPGCATPTAGRSSRSTARRDTVDARRHGDVPDAATATAGRSTTGGSRSWPTGSSISLRTGCFCNPGAGEVAHHLGAGEMRQWFGRDEPVSFLELREQLLVEHDLLVAAIRISVGVATNFTDVFRFLCFMQGFVDRTVDEIGQVEFVSDNCRIVATPPESRLRDLHLNKGDLPCCDPSADVLDGLTAGGKRAGAPVVNETPGARRGRHDHGDGRGGVRLRVFRASGSGAMQVVASFFFVEFLMRVTAGTRVSPIGCWPGWMTRRQPPDWVSAKPKRFAWTLGLAMSFAMMIITNYGIQAGCPGRSAAYLEADAADRAGQAAWMPPFVMMVMVRAMASPSVQANRLGLADTHCGGCRCVSQWATKPVGLRSSPAATRSRKSTKKKVLTILIGQNNLSKLA